MLTTVKIQGFKSLYDVDVDLGQVNVFIGANGSGKSNLLEAVGLLSATASRLGDKEKQEPLKFYDQELFQRGIRPSVTKLFLSSFLHNDEPKLIFFEAYFQSSSRATRYSVGFPSNTIRANVTAFGGGFEIHEEEKSAKDYSTLIKNYAIFSPNTAILRGTQPDITQRLPIGLAGGRLAEAVDQLLNTDESVFGNLDLDELFELLDWVDEIAVVPPSKGLISSSVPTTRSIIRFTDRWMSTTYNQLSAYDASEGALYVLFALVLAMHPQSPQFFAIDNFDQAMHPRLARATMRVFSQELLKTERQVLLTTHNPLVLDGLDLRDDRIRLFAVERDRQGATQIHRVQVSDEILNATQDGLSLSNLWVMGRLGGVPDLF